MVKIITDSSTLYSPAEAEAIGLTVLPLSVTIAGKSYREFAEISADEFVAIINQGHMPTSSQPAVGEVMDAYEKYADCEIINVSMCDGLSGTYKSAIAAKQSLENSDNIHVFNTRTLCGPHRYMVQKALEMAKGGASCREILDKMEYYSNNHRSFPIPRDFGYLKRGGRLTPMAANVGSLLKLVPVMTQTKDWLKLEKSGMFRSIPKAIDAVAAKFLADGVGENHILYVSHGADMQLATSVKEMLTKHFPNTEINIVDLSPAFITQGGPGCVAIQSIIK